MCDRGSGNKCLFVCLSGSHICLLLLSFTVFVICLELFLNLICNWFGKCLEPFRNFFTAVWELFGNFLGTVWELFWNCFETVLELSGNCLDFAVFLTVVLNSV